MLKLNAVDHAWIARHVPHQGSMCLLDGVEAWDVQHIQCRAASHRAPENPLRAFGRLGASCGIEYAAQAMVVHRALLASGGGAAAGLGYLVSLRSVHLRVSRLDDIAADLAVSASCVVHSGNTALYRFSVAAAEILLLDGRATVLIDANMNRPITGEAQ